jgi:hypothetical protein
MTNMEMSALNPDATSTWAGRAAIPELKADKYLAWINSRELPDFGSSQCRRSRQKTLTNIQRQQKKQKKCAILRYETDDVDLRHPLAKKSGLQHSRYDGF